MTAGIAAAAENLRLNGDLLTDLQSFDIFADGIDARGNLMALCDGVGGERMLSVVDVNVRAADTDPHDFQADLTRTDRRNGDVGEFNFMRVCHNLLLHGDASCGELLFV